jgi:hypothetical protein
VGRTPASVVRGSRSWLQSNKVLSTQLRSAFGHVSVAHGDSGSHRNALGTWNRSHPRERGISHPWLPQSLDPKRAPFVLLGTDQSLSSYPQLDAKLGGGKGIPPPAFIIEGGCPIVLSNFLAYG